MSLFLLPFRMPLARLSICSQEEEPEQLGSAVDLLLAKISNPIKEWISICKAINTRYVAEGTRLNIHRWDNIPEDRMFYSVFGSLVELSKEVDMYLVKWRGLSYLHCSWEFEEDLMAFEKQTMKQKILVCSPFSSDAIEIPKESGKELL